MLLMILSIITVLSIIFLVISLVYDWEDSIATTIGILAAIGVIGWLMLGTLLTNKSNYKILIKDKLEILKTKNKIIVIDEEDNLFTYENAKIYNLIVSGNDKFYIKRTKHNLYNFEIGSEIIITDSITQQKIIEQVYANVQER